MKCLNLIKNKLELKNEEIESIRLDLENVERILGEYQISFENHFEISFWNHIVSFIKRAQKNEFVDDFDDNLASEITEESVKISRKLLTRIFKRYEREEKLSEIYLVAIHIQVAMARS